MKRVAFQGELGAYSELAVRQYFSDAHPVACRDFRDVADLLIRAAVDRAVLPVENTLAGPVPGIAQLLENAQLQVEAEIWLPIHHCLLCVPGSSFAQVTSVLSHPVALAQCTRFFAEHPRIRPQQWFDTAGAAMHVGMAGDPTLAAIASEAAAEHYALDIVARNLEDSADNRTRFVVVAACNGT